MSIDDLSREHMAHWFERMRTVACIMAAQSSSSGQRLFWDPAKEAILDHAPLPLAAG